MSTPAPDQLKVLVCHNFYQQPGGEDGVFAAEVDLLRSHGHAVVTHTVHNDSIASLGQITVARRTIWNNDSNKTLRALLAKERPHVVHFHNTFPILSPAAYHAARSHGAAVVQTLHNYRLLCPGATFFRAGKVCEDCLPKSVPYPAVKHKCYRDNRPATAAVAAMLATHRALGTYRKSVNAYVALTAFSRQKFLDAGLPADRLFVKPNFVSPDPGPGQPSPDRHALFVGRLAPEKGIETLLAAWATMPPDRPLKIVGDGPLAETVTAFAAHHPHVTYLGRRPAPEILDLMGQASLLIFPSTWYEGFPRTIVEAYAKGLPVLASRLGSMIELVTPHQTGAHFHPADPTDLAAQANALLNNPTLLAHLSATARQTYLKNYTAPQNHTQLLTIYHQALQQN